MAVDSCTSGDEEASESETERSPTVPLQTLRQNHRRYHHHRPLPNRSISSAAKDQQVDSRSRDGSNRSIKNETTAPYISQAPKSASSQLSFASDNFHFSPTDSVQDFEGCRSATFSQPRTPTAYTPAAESSEASPITTLSRSSEQRFDTAQSVYVSSNAISRQSAATSNHQLQLVTQGVQASGNMHATTPLAIEDVTVPNSYFPESAQPAAVGGGYQGGSDGMAQQIEGQYEQGGAIDCGNDSGRDQLLSVASMQGSEPYTAAVHPQPQSVWFESVPYQQPMAIAHMPQYGLDRAFSTYDLGITPHDFLIKQEQDTGYVLPGARF
ncbi:MAG: hypothetical protein M1825_004026 [Sarcosagium campestre]|nr:MAG: hypothetical protein M1825_004026 [Sarcosagium campestre]